MEISRSNNCNEFSEIGKKVDKQDCTSHHTGRIDQETFDKAFGTKVIGMVKNLSPCRHQEGLA